MAIQRVEPKGENFSVAVGIGLTALLYEYYVPARLSWRLSKFGNYLGTVAAWGVAYWEIRVNGVLVPGGQIFDQVGYAAQREFLTKIFAASGDHVEIYGINPTAAILDMGGSLGWDLEYGS